MASRLLSAVEVVLRGRTENIRNSFKEANTGLEQMASKLVRLRTLAISTFGAYTVARGLGAVASTAMEFEKQMAEVHTMLRLGNEKYLPEYTKAVQELSIEFGQSTEKIAAALYDWLSALAPPSEALEVLRVSLVLAAGGMTDAQTAAVGMVRILKAFKLEFTEAAHVADLMWGVVNQGVIRIPELADEIGKIASTARAAGIGLEELMALIAVVVQVESPARAMTALRAAILTVSKTGEGLQDVVRYLKEAGLATIQFAGFTRRSSVATSVLTGNLKDLDNQLAFMRSVSGLAMEAFGKQADTTHFRWQQFLQLIEHFKRVMGEEVAKSLIVFADSIAKSSDAIARLGKGLGMAAAFLIKIGSWNIYLTAFLAVSVALIPIMSGLGKAFYHLGLGAKYLYAAMIRKTTAQVAATTATVAQTLAISSATAAERAYQFQVMGTTAALKMQTIALGTSTAAVTAKVGALAVAKAAILSFAGVIGGPLIAAFAIAGGWLYMTHRAFKQAENDFKRTQKAAEEFAESVNKIEAAIDIKIRIEGFDEITAKLQERLNFIKAKLETWVPSWGETFTFQWWSPRERLGLEQAQIENNLAALIKYTEQMKLLQKIVGEKSPYAKFLEDEDPIIKAKAFAFINKKLIQDAIKLEIKLTKEGQEQKEALIKEEYRKKREAAKISSEAVWLINQNMERELAISRKKYRQKEEEEERKHQKKLLEERTRLHKDSISSIAELMIKLTRAGLEEQLYLIDLQRQEALRKVEEVGARADLINLKYDLLIQEMTRNFQPGAVGGGRRGVSLQEAGMLTRVPGYKDPAQILHKDNVDAQGLRRKQLRRSDEISRFLENIDSKITTGEPIEIWNP